MACVHISQDFLRLPFADSRVYKEECTKCFDSQDDEAGIDVCLTCFNAGCCGEQKHRDSHFAFTQHPLILHIKRSLKSSQEDNTITRLAIGVPGGAQENAEYDIFTSVHCLSCEIEIDPTHDLVSNVVSSIMAANTAEQQEDIKAWEAEELGPCPHTLDFPQQEQKKLSPQDAATCDKCDLSEGLWLCMVCGHLGCARRNDWDPQNPGGNNHAIEHALSSSHGVAVKLRTITPEGKADVHCYICDNDPNFNYGDVTDPNLADHLLTFGVNIAQVQKTEKSLAELELERNQNFDFSTTTEDGKTMETMVGPGFTGLKNLGNTCYMASIVQTLFSLPEFIQRYYQELQDHLNTCIAVDVGDCFHCQFAKIADGLWSGRYSRLPSDQEVDLNSVEFSIAPRMFKHMVGRGHSEFSTMRQQDAFEYYQHLLNFMHRKEHQSGFDPVSPFRFKLQERFECSVCHSIKYRQSKESDISLGVPLSDEQVENALYDTNNKDAPREKVQVPLHNCFSSLISPDFFTLDCPTCGSKTNHAVTRGFKSFPKALVLQVRRFGFYGGSYVPRKLNVDITFPDLIDLSEFYAEEPQHGELVLQDESQVQSAGPQADESLIASLMDMGFPRVRCEKALINTGNNMEAACQWIFEHMDDHDIDEPIQATIPNAPSDSPPEELIGPLIDMGFSRAKAAKALRETDMNPDRAVEWIFSHMDEPDEEEPHPTTDTQDTDMDMDTDPPVYQVVGVVAHRGPSVNTGHYVAFVKREDRWIIFNDRKVAHHTCPPLGEGYIYFLRKLAQ